MKLAVNALIFGLNGAVAEGLVLAERAGIERALAYDVLAASAAGAPLLGYKRDVVRRTETTPVAFSLALAEKDLRLIAAFAEALGRLDATVGHQSRADPRRGADRGRGRRLLDGREPPAQGGPAMTDRP